MTRLSRAQSDALRVQRYLRARTGPGAAVGPFSIQFSAASDSLFANYAIPWDDAAPDAKAIAALVAAFASRNRRPRLEYVPAAAPAVEPALLAAGFVEEMRPDLMTRRPGRAVAIPRPEGIEIAFVRDPAGLAAAAEAQAVAFGMSEPEAHWLEDAVTGGGRVLLARCARTGEAAGAGAFTPPIDGVAEVVGIGVPPAWRRRGIAQAITAMLAEEAFRVGCRMVFLSSGGDAQTAIYRRAGFTRRPPMLFISKPPAE